MRFWNEVLDKAQEDLQDESWIIALKLIVNWDIEIFFSVYLNYVLNHKKYSSET